MSREIDAAVCKEVLGLKPFRPCDVKAFQNTKHPFHPCFTEKDWLVIPSGKPPRTHMIDSREVPHYSEGWSCLSDIVLKMRERDLRLSLYEQDDGEWCAQWCRGDLCNGELGEATEKSAPLAVCVSALLAVGFDPASLAALRAVGGEGGRKDG